MAPPDPTATVVVEGLMAAGVVVLAGEVWADLRRWWSGRRAARRYVPPGSGPGWHRGRTW